MYLILFWWLNLPRGRAKKLHPINSATCWSGLSSNFCNMLMCATIGPQGSGFYTSPKWGKSTADTTDTGEYECMCDIWCSGWGGCWEIPDRLYCRNKPPKGHAWSPFLKTHTHTGMHTPHSLSLYPEVHTLPPSALPLFYVHTYTQTHTSLLLRIQPSQLICLKVNLAFLLLSFLQSSSPQFPALTLRSNWEKANLSLYQFNHLCYLSTYICLPYLLDLTAFCSHEDQWVVLVDVGNDWGHFVNGVRKERLASHHLRDAQWSIHVQATKVVVNGQELQGKQQLAQSDFF